MRYRDIEPTSNRFRLPPSHQILAEVSIDLADQYRFEQFAEENCDTEIVGHEAAPDGRIAVLVACIDEETRQKLDAGWA